MVDKCLEDFPNTEPLRFEQKMYLFNLSRGKDVFAMLSIGFGKSIIFPLFPCVVKALRSSEGMPTIIVVSPLVSIMRDQLEQLKQLGFSAAAMGIREECNEDEENVRNSE